MPHNIAPDAELLSTAGRLTLEGEIDLLSTRLGKIQEFEKSTLFKVLDVLTLGLADPAKKREVKAELSGLREVLQTQQLAQEEALALQRGGLTNILGLQESLTLALL